MYMLENEYTQENIDRSVQTVKCTLEFLHELSSKFKDITTRTFKMCEKLPAEIYHTQYNLMRSKTELVNLMKSERAN